MDDRMICHPIKVLWAAVLISIEAISMPTTNTTINKTTHFQISQKIIALYQRYTVRNKISEAREKHKENMKKQC